MLRIEAQTSAVCVKYASYIFGSLPQPKQDFFLSISPSENRTFRWKTLDSILDHQIPSHSGGRITICGKHIISQLTTGVFSP